MSVGAMWKQVLFVLFIILVLVSTQALAATPPIHVEHFDTLDESRIDAGAGNTVELVNGAVNGTALHILDTSSNNAYYMVLNHTQLLNLNVAGNAYLYGGYYKILSYGNDGVALFSVALVGNEVGFIVTLVYNGEFVFHINIRTDIFDVYSTNVTLPDSGWHKIFAEINFIDESPWTIKITKLIIDDNVYNLSYSRYGSTVDNPIDFGGLLVGALDKYTDSGGNTRADHAYNGEIYVDDFGIYTDLTDLPPAPTETVTVTETVTSATTTTVTTTVTDIHTEVQTDTETLTSTGKVKFLFAGYDDKFVTLAITLFVVIVIAAIVTMLLRG